MTKKLGYLLIVTSIIYLAIATIGMFIFVDLDWTMFSVGAAGITGALIAYLLNE